MKKHGARFLLLAILLKAGFLNFEMVGVKAEASYLLITEVYYDTIGDDSVEEWVEIYNPNSTEVDLSNYKIGDEETAGGNEGMFRFPDGAKIEGGEQMVVAKNTMGFYNLYAKFPDFEIDTTDDGVTDFSETPDMTKYSSWSTGSFSLTNTGDEVLLINALDVVVDAVVFEGGNLAGVIPHPGVSLGQSIARKDLEADTNDCSVDFEKIYNPHPGYGWIYEAEDGFTNVGTMMADGSAERGLVVSAETDLTTAGYIFYGPYEDSLPEGMYQANFRLKINDNTQDQVVAIIDAHNCGGLGVYEHREIYATDFLANNSWQNFGLWFERRNEGSMEWRVWFNDEVNLSFDNVLVGRVDRLIYEAEDMWHQTGSLIKDPAMSGGAGWTAGPGDGVNYSIYGPYDSIADGGWTAGIVTRINDNQSEQGVMIFNINNTFGTDEDKNLLIKGTDFQVANGWQRVDLDFAKTDGGLMEYRVFSLALLEVIVDNIILHQTTNIRYEAENMYGNGQIVKDNLVSGGKFRQSTVDTTEAGWMVYGPYTKDQPEGQYTAKFRLKTAENSTDDLIAIISVFNFGGSGVEEAMPIFGTDFSAVNSWHDFTIDFTRVNEGVMEYRVYFTDIADVSVDFVEIEEVTNE